MRNKFILYFLLILSAFACSKDDATENPNGLSTTAEKFLTEVLDIMENNSINRLEINWSDFRNEVFEAARGSQTISDTDPGIRRALELLGDNHSVFFKNTGEVIFAGTLRCDAPTITAPSLPSDIGYVKVNSFSGSSNSDDALSFARKIQNQIKNNDHSEIRGWVVDLRGNLGGNMWPMLAGIGPVLGEGIAGFFTNPEGLRSSWSYQNGASLLNTQPLTLLSDAYTLITPNPKVAVLLDGAVASSGEVMAVSFIGRENTRSFGSPTCGLSTSNATFNLSNNSTLLLTTSYLADRNRNLYGIPIEPDQISDDENIIQDVIDWIQN